MEDFDKILDLLATCKTAGKGVYIIGFKGNINEWYGDELFKDRPKESQRQVKAGIFVLSNKYRKEYYLNWVKVYRDTKGVYFKTQKKKYYLVEGNINEKLYIVLK